jgi:hypothetical protein
VTIVARRARSCQPKRDQRGACVEASFIRDGERRTEYGDLGLKIKFEFPLFIVVGSRIKGPIHEENMVVSVNEEKC